jgi:hypothetical protein
MLGLFHLRESAFICGFDVFQAGNWPFESQPNGD